jgi:hypothetical protein
MKIRLKARRIPGDDPVTFKNPGGDPIYLKDIGSVSQEISDQVAVELVSRYPDILEYETEKKVDYEPKMAKNYENKTTRSRIRDIAETSAKDVTDAIHD